MTQHAQDAINETFWEEQQRADFLRPGEPVHRLFAWGASDETSLRTESAELIGMLHRAPGRFAGPALGLHSGAAGGQRAEAAEVATEAAQELAASARKHLRAWQMRLGMARQLVEGRPLSPKQRAWMDTNWKGGSDGFEQDIVRPGTINDLERVARLVERLAGHPNRKATGG